MSRALVLTALVSWAAPALAQTPPAGTTVDASRGGITISSGVNSLTIGARVQVRWTLDDRDMADADTAGSGVGREDGVLSGFDVPRLRLTLSGGAFKPWLRYAFQFEMSRAGGEGGSRIKDAILEIRPVGQSYRFQVGQFKAPFGLQQLTSSGRLQFVERAITDQKFNPTRDMGAMFSGTVAARRLGYEVGVFNGSGESVRQNNRSHLWVLRGYLNPLGVYTLSEGISDTGDRPILHVGGAIRGGKQIRGRTPSGVFDNADDQRAYNVEVAYKHPRFYSTAEYFWMRDEQSLGARDIDSRGFHAQLGMTALPKRAEIAVMVARLEGDTRLDDAAVLEVRTGISYYWLGHNLKLQADVGGLQYGAGYRAQSSRALQGLPPLGARLVAGQALGDRQVRVQLQLAF